MKIGRTAGFILLSLFAAASLAACGGGGGGAALVVEAPVVTTGSATADSTDNAVMNGTVNPNGAATTVWFEYGTDNTLDNNTTTTVQNAGSGTSAAAATETVTGLIANTTYYYRIAASNSGGTSRGAILSCTTLPDPPVVTTLPASASPDNAVLNGTVNSNGAATDVWFEYGTDNTLATNTPTTAQNAGAGISAVAVADDIVGLAATTTYYYRIAATNSGGTTRGAIVSFTTPSNPLPIADAGPDQNVMMRGPSGPNMATLTAAGSTDDPFGGTITGYLWTQLSGLAVTLNDNTAVSPTFTVPQFAYGASQNLVFKVEVTTDRAGGITATDIVNVNVNWGWLDDFSTDTTGTYTVLEDPDPNAGAFSYGAGVAEVTTGVNNTIYFSQLFGMAGYSSAQYTAKFSIDYRPSASYDPNGGIVVSLGDDNNTYFRISTRPGEHFVEKWRAGVLVGDSGAAFAGTINLGQTYPIVISYTRRVTIVQAFGQIITLVGGDNGIPITYFSVLTQERDATFDNARLEYRAP